MEGKKKERKEKRKKKVKKPKHDAAIQASQG